MFFVVAEQQILRKLIFIQTQILRQTTPSRPGDFLLLLISLHTNISVSYKRGLCSVVLWSVKASCCALMCQF